MARHVSAEVEDIVENPDHSKCASLVIVAENVSAMEIKERVSEADGEIDKELPGGVYMAEVPEARVESLCGGDLIESISLNGTLRLA